MAIVVRLSSEWDPKGIEKAVKDINNAGKKLDSISANTKKTSDSFSSLGNGVKKLGIALVASFGAREIGRFFTSSIQGVIELEAAQSRLRKILLTTGGATNSQVAALLKQADALEKVGVVSKENIIVAQGQLATFDLNADTIKRLTPAILNYVTAEKGATASAEDFKSMTNGLAQALQGNFGSLTRTGFVLDDATKKLIANGTEAERVTAIISVLDSTYKGFNQSLLDTPEGKLIKIRQGFGDLKEEVGFALLDSIDKASGSTENFATTLKTLGTDIGDFIRGATDLTLKFGELAESIGFADSETTSLMDETVTLGDKIIALIPVLGTYIRIIKDRGTAERILNSVTDTNKVLMMERSRELRKNRKELEGNTTTTEEAKKALEELKKESIDAAKKIKANLESELDKARSKLDQAKSAFDSFRNAIASPIKNIVNFGELGTGANFVENLENQTQKATTFAQKIQKLIKLGLNESAIQQVLNAGYDAGSNIADQIIAGGASVVNKVNQLTASLNYVAESTGTLAATQFYQAGIDSAQNFVNGLIAQINASAAAIAKAIADAGVGKTSTAPAAIEPPPLKKQPPKPMIPGRANGGPVSAGFPYIVGERGPELFMPSTSGSILNNARTKNMNNGGVTINVNAGNVVGSKEELLAFVQRGLREYDRRNGKLNING
jgi:hypothetical protein